MSETEARSEEAGGVSVDGALSGQNQAQSRQERSFDQGKRCDNNSVQKQNLFFSQMKIRFISYLYTQLLAIIDVVKVSMVENGKMTGICLRTSSLFAMLTILTMMTMMVAMTMMVVMTMMTILINQPTTI